MDRGSHGEMKEEGWGGERDKNVEATADSTCYHTCIYMYISWPHK